MTLPDGPRLPTAVQMWKYMSRPVEFLTETERRFGDLFTLQFTGLPRFVVVSRPAHVQALFSSSSEEVDAGGFNGVMRPFLGDGSIMMLDGPDHLRQRRVIMAPLHGERMRAYGQAMVALARDAVDAWPTGTALSAHRSFQQTTLQIILRTVFGLGDGEVRQRFTRAMTDVLEGASWPWLLFPLLRVDAGPWSPWGKFLRARAEADALLYAEIARRRKSHERGDDVLSLLLAAKHEDGSDLTDLELRDHLFGLLVAGHETTASALAWVLYYVLRTDGLAARLADEVGPGPLDPDRLAALPLLEATIKETLRIQPVLPAFGRILRTPLEIGGHTFAPGQRIMVSVVLAHRRPELYPDPTRFRPERFLERTFSITEWYPFGGGARRCVGMHFAIYEMKMVLGALLSRTKLSLAPGGDGRPVRRGISLSPPGGMPVIRVDHEARTPLGGTVSAPRFARGWKAALKEATGLVGLLVSPGADSRRVYGLLGEHHAVGENSLYLNLGYWADPTITTLDQASEALVDLLGERAGLCAKDVVVDAGSGFGDPAIRWAERFSVAKLIGFNVTPMQVARGRARVEQRGLTDRVDLREGSATATGLAAASVDKVLTLEAAHHFDTREDFFRECLRILKPRGLLCGVDVVPLPGKKLPYSLRAVWQIPAANLYPKDVYAQKLAAAGFQDVSVVSIREHVLPAHMQNLARRLQDPDLIARMNPVLRAASASSGNTRAVLDAMDYVLVVARKA